MWSYYRDKNLHYDNFYIKFLLIIDIINNQKDKIIVNIEM